MSKVEGVQSVHSKIECRVLRTGSGQNLAHGLQPLSSPAMVGQSVGTQRAVVGKMWTHTLDLYP